MSWKTLSLTLVASTILLASTGLIAVTPIYAQQGLTILWSISAGINDVAVSADGRYIAAVSDQTLLYFQAENPDPQWTASTPALGYSFLSVAISADGEYVAAGDSEGYVRYFAGATSRTGDNQDPTWVSRHLWGGSIEKGTLDISDDGEYIAVGGTGISVYYFTECTTKSGWDVGWDWSGSTGASELTCLDMTPDGRYIAVGGSTQFTHIPLEGPVETSQPPPYIYYFPPYIAFLDGVDETLLWDMANGDLEGEVKDIAVSDDGYGVAAVVEAVPFPPFNEEPASGFIWYWADATGFSGEPDPTWEYSVEGEPFRSVAISGDGNMVAAGSISLTLYFWSNSRTLSGVAEPDWSKPLEIVDVAVSWDGSVVAASTVEDGSYYLRVFDRSGWEFDSYQLDSPGEVVSMSRDGSIIAVGGPEYDSLYVFKCSPPRVVGGYLVSTSLIDLALVLTILLLLALLAAPAYTVLRRSLVAR